MSAWTGQVFLGTGVFLYLGPGARAEAHAHHAVQLVWSRAGARLIPSGERHALAASGPIALMLVEAHGDRGRALDRRARAMSSAEVTAALARVAPPTARTARTWCDAVIGALAGPADPPPLSSVSRRAIEYVEANLDGTPRLATAAARVRISPTRLTHVFTREVGIPFRRFVLWSRIKRAAEAVRDGDDLGRAAVAAGFSDAAHFSRTFRQMFGLSPSALAAGLRR